MPLQDKYYSSEKGIDKETSLWSSLFGAEEGETAATADWVRAADFLICPVNCCRVEYFAPAV